MISWGDVYKHHLAQHLTHNKSGINDSYLLTSNEEGFSQMYTN